ncbi:unnamed protein product [Blepharisma stoltei]|uniref:Uncharacterized protein n=1 Tax=Blepharisma stoltei TaxID=1481888 RepID=A0AAU9IGL5_9CILI|nr:unnamed protein product [Blepharisma stoltei]
MSVAKKSCKPSTIKFIPQLQKTPEEARPCTRVYNPEENLPSKRNPDPLSDAPQKRIQTAVPFALTDIEFYLKELDEIFTNRNKRVEINDSSKPNPSEKSVKNEDLVKREEELSKPSDNEASKVKIIESEEIIVNTENLGDVREEIKLTPEETAELKLKFIEDLNKATKLTFTQLNVVEKFKIPFIQDSWAWQEKKPVIRDFKISQFKGNSYEKSKGNVGLSKRQPRKLGVDITSLLAEIPISLRPIFTGSLIVKPIKLQINIRANSYQEYKKLIASPPIITPVE